MRYETGKSIKLNAEFIYGNSLPPLPARVCLNSILVAVLLLHGLACVPSMSFLGLLKTPLTNTSFDYAESRMKFAVDIDVRHLLQQIVFFLF